MHFVLQSIEYPALAPLFSVLLQLRQLALTLEWIVEITLNSWFSSDHLPGLNEHIPHRPQGFRFFETSVSFWHIIYIASF